MSTTDPTPDPDELAPEATSTALRGASDWVLRIVLPVLVATLFIGVLVYERGTHDVDLRVIAPAEVAPGDPIPLRAFVLEGVSATELPRVVSHPVRIDTQPMDLERPAGTPLTPSPVAGVEGTLVAGTEVGEQRLYLVATLPEGEHARVQRRIAVTRTPAASARVPRTTTSAREYQPGPLRAESNAPSGLRLDARVPSGVCVPEVPCELLVWMGGEVPARVQVEPGQGLEVLDAPGPTTGIASLTLVVRRLEATVTLRAVVDDAVVARRAVQLPMSPGGLLAAADRVIVPAGQSVTVSVSGVSGPSAAVVNVFRGGHWVAATSIAASEDGEAAPTVTLPPLAPGLHHVQAQASAFDVQGSGVAVVCAYPPDDSPEACLLALTGDARVRAREDELAATLRGDHPPLGEEDAARAFRFLSHDHARDLYALPFPSSGLEQLAYGADERISGSRVVVALAMLLMGLVAASIVLRRAREGANVAEAVMREAGASDDETHVTRGRLGRATWLAALLVLGAFVLVAIMVLSRGM